jgi:hypothetical protein
MIADDARKARPSELVVDFHGKNVELLTAP